MGEIKVLHCIHSLSWGGLEIYTVELVQKLAELGIQQKVLCSAHGRVAVELKKSGIETVEFPEKKLSKFRESLLIRRLLRKEGFTHIHSHTRLDMWAAALSLWGTSKTPHIYNLYMNATPKQDFVHRWLFSKVQALCSSSENILADVKKNFPIAPEKLHLIRYGRNTENFHPYPQEREQLRSLYKVGAHQLVFGTLCRIDPGKGVRELAQSLEHLTDSELARVQLWIIGDPTIIGKDNLGNAIPSPESAALQEWLNVFKENPRYQKHLIQIPFQKNYVPYIEALDIFTLASYNETYSLSVLDAMMMAKPVIGTNAGGTPEQVGANERGRLAEPHSAESIAKAIRYYIENPHQIANQGKRAQEWSVEKHRWPDTQKAFIDLYKKLK